MKIQVTKTIEEKVEIELALPAYFTFTLSEYKIISETQLIEVYSKYGYSYIHEIKDRVGKIEEIFREGTLSSESNFIAMLEKAKAHMDELVNKHSPIPA